MERSSAGAPGLWLAVRAPLLVRAYIQEGSRPARGLADAVRRAPRRYVHYGVLNVRGGRGETRHKPLLTHSSMLQCRRLLAAIIALLAAAVACGDTAGGAGDPCEARSGNPEPVPCLRVPRCPGTASVDQFYVNTVPGSLNQHP